MHTDAIFRPFRSDELECTPYPRYSDCHGGDRYFCSMWRSVGFLMSFAVVLEGMTIAAFVVLLVGGKQKREQGWGFMATMAALAALVQAVGGSLVVCRPALRSCQNLAAGNKLTLV